jgi:TonB family protein
VRDVQVLESSGYAPLDESAVTTVRRRWRFPARAGDASSERRVRVPIRFRLEDARG